MRTLAAIVAYLMAAVSGLAAGYYATAPRATAAISTRMAPHEAHRDTGSPAQLDAVAAYLSAEEQRATAASDGSPGPDASGAGL